jgi:hypothetical protein
MTPTDPTPQELRWLDGLAGRSPTPASEDTTEEPALRQALQLRDYFALADQEIQTRASDPASEERLIRRLRARGALPATSPNPKAPMPLGQRLSALLDWLLPAGGTTGPRYALIAGLALAVTALPLILRHPAPDDDAMSVKAVKPGTLQGGTRLMIVPDPGTQAAAIVRTLAEAGIQADLKRKPDGTIELTAHIEPGQRRAAQEKLMPWGLVIGVDGQLAVQLAPAP